MTETISKVIPTTLADIRSNVANEMQAVTQMIADQLNTSVDMIMEVSQHLIGSGGKRIRPLIVLLSALSCGYQGKQHIELAAIIEFVHTATLLHDDVVDESQLRRGRNTANAEWGNAVPVLIGDFVYTRAFQMITRIQNQHLMTVLADATNVISEGEVKQLINRHNNTTTEQQYMQVIEDKTAKLFEIAARFGPIIANANTATETALTNYGLHLGLAYQLIDDMLDYTGTSESLGKNIGDDLAEGKPTLPLIYALKHAQTEQANQIKQAIQQGGIQHLTAIIKTIQATNALHYTKQKAIQHATLAKNALSKILPSKYKQALIQLIDFTINRQQ